MPTEKLEPPAAPYKYLDHYGLGDQPIFCGREREIRSLVTDVIVSRLVVLFAATGTGKTSLINAGVRPRLEGWQGAERPPETERRFVTHYVRVREDPARSIRAALAGHEPVSALGDGDPLAPALAELSRRLELPIVLFLDQFEEFFLYRDPARSGRKRQFVEDVAALYSDRESGVHLVFSMREEFLGKMDVFREEIPTIFHKESQLRLGWFRREQAEEAIARPPEHFGVKVEAELVEAILKDLLTEDGVEPAQLQIVCHSLWRSRSEGEDALTLEHYRRLAEGQDVVPLRAEDELEDSFAKRVLGRRFEADLRGLESKPALDTLAAVLPELCTPEGTKRIRDLSALSSAPGVEASLLPEVAKYLADTRLARTFERDGVNYLELSHDYLVTRMPALLARVRTLYARRALSKAMSQLSKSGAPPLPEDLEAIYERVDDLALDVPQASTLLFTALVWDSRPLEWSRIAGRVGFDAAGLFNWTLKPDNALPAPIKQTVLQLLSQIGNERAVSLLVEALGDDELAPMAADALANVQTPAAVKALADLLAKGRHTVEALNALKRLSRSRRQETAEAARAAIERFESSRQGGGGGGHAPGPTTTRPDVDEAPAFRGSTIPPPFGYIRRLFEEGTVVPFVGAGINFSARTPGAAWHEGAPFLPSGPELAAYLAEVCEFPADEGRDARHDLLRVAAYFQETIGRDELQRLLSRIASADQQPGPVHRFLAETRAPLLILTTNFDELLERAFEEAGKPYDVVTYSDGGRGHGEMVWWEHGRREPRAVSASMVEPDLQRTTVIFKLAGSLRRADAVEEGQTGYLITEDDYVDMLANLLGPSPSVPVAFRKHLSRPFLFMGLSLDNWYVRALLRALRGHTPSKHSRSWAILYRPSAFTARLWERQGIQVYDMRAEEFVSRLRVES